MTRLVHITDLHFGRARPELLAPLTQAICAAAPDLVLMGGDFVQRARPAQFAEARAFLDGLGLPWIGVPGNHDIPLWNLPQRLLSPYRAWTRHVRRERRPERRLPDALVLGLDTTDPYAHQRGRISRRTIRHVATRIASERRTVVLLAHHPFHHRPETEKKLMQGAPAALEAWEDAGAHVILSGHLHSWLVEPFVSRKGAGRTLQVHTGTGLSSRLRGEPNDFAILDLDGPDVSVTRMTEADHAFTATACHRFQRSAAGWTDLTTDPASG